MWKYPREVTKMPELPDVQVYKEYLDATSLHHKVTTVEVGDNRTSRASARSLTRAMKGQAFEETHRHGKHLFVRLCEGGWLHVHFGMTGGLRYYKKEEKRPEHSRVVVGFENGFHLALVSQRLFGSIGPVEEPEDFIKEKKLGPDALDVSCEEYVDILHGRRGTIKSALMNQSAIAGVGNIYSDEILFHARLLPDRPAADFDASTLEDLWRTSRKVLGTAIKARVDTDRMPTDWLLTHRSEGEKCPGCRGEVSNKKISGRRSYFCPGCQK